MIGSTTDQKDDAAMNEGGTGSDSSTADIKERLPTYRKDHDREQEVILNTPYI